VTDNIVTVEDWASTVYYLLGIDKEKTLMAPGNRPVKIVDGGNVIKDIIV
jgi:arylsulfatase A-like enzyme